MPGSEPESDTLSNQGGEVFAQQALDAQLSQLNNAKGSLIGSQSLSLSVGDLLRNDGLLGSDGQLKLTVGQLENGAGLIQAGKDLQLTAASVNNADKGQILALGKEAASSWRSAVSWSTRARLPAMRRWTSMPLISITTAVACSRRTS